MTFFIIIVYDVMGTDTMAGKYFRDLMEYFAESFRTVSNSIAFSRFITD